MTRSTKGARQKNAAPFLSPEVLLPPSAPVKRVAIIGAGIAGGCLAFALHQRGVTVDVYEQASTSAAEASGNPLGLVMLRLDRGKHPPALFRHQAFLHAVSFYESLGPNGFVSRGVYDYLHSAEKRQQLLQAQLFSTTDLYESNGALYHRLAGVINPRQTIKHLLQHANMTYNGTIAIAEMPTAATAADAVILASGRGLAQLSGLPLHHHAGQVNWLDKAFDNAGAMPTVMGDGYVTTHEGLMVFGATFEKWANPQQSPEPSHAATVENSQRLQNLLPESQRPAITAHNSGARAAIRVSTPDRLPIVGRLRDNLYPNLYTLGALGPRGLTMAPLCAEVLAAFLCREPLPIDAEMWERLQPLRLSA